ncbi:MAG: hypothetical protein FJZ92_13810 [Chloroflexi bacterium]|nr:hypothetical protein [Chloroflexota bacterium]
MWEAVLVLAIASLGIARIADVVNELLAPVLPARLGSTQLSWARVILWIVGAIEGVIAVIVIEYDPLAAIGVVTGAADVWNILLIVTIVDAAHAFFVHRLLRA